jgi:hypothetical protein
LFVNIHQPIQELTNQLLKGMVERRCDNLFMLWLLWYTAWVDAGQPELKYLEGYNFNKDDLQDLDSLSKEWKNGILKDRDCDYVFVFLCFFS